MRNNDTDSRPTDKFYNLGKKHRVSDLPPLFRLFR